MPKDLKVRIVGDASSYERTLGTAESRTKRFGRALGDMGKIAGGILITQGLEKVASGIHSTIKAAEESEKVQAALEAQLKASGESYTKFGGQIDKTVNSLSKMSGLDDEDLSSAFIRLDRASGDAKQSLEQLDLVADISRARNIDVAKAADLVAKAMDGNAGALRRYGVQVEKGATAHEILAAAQQKFAGQAEAYGQTAAGAHDKVNVAIENVQESIGAKLLPAWDKMMTWAADQLPKISAFFDTHGGSIKKVLDGIQSFIRDQVIPRLDAMKTVFQSMVKGIKKVLDDNGPEIRQILEGVQKVAKAIGDTLLWLTQKVVVPVLKPMFETVLPTAIGIAIKSIAALFDIVGKVKDGFIWIGNTAASLWKKFADAIGPIADTITAALRPVFAVANSIRSAMDWIINHAKLPDIHWPSIPNPLGGILHRAAGGPLVPGMPTILGEHGPELVIPTGPGTVVNAADTRRALSGGGSGTSSGGTFGTVVTILQVDGRTLWESVRPVGMRDSRYLVEGNVSPGQVRGALA